MPSRVAEVDVVGRGEEVGDDEAGEQVDEPGGGLGVGR